MKGPKKIIANNYRVDPKLYTKNYYFDDTYAGSKEYKEGLNSLAPSVDYIYQRLPLVNKLTRFLDAGCGKGELLYFMHKKGYEVYGVDYSQTAIRLTKTLMRKKHIRNAVIRREDVRRLSFSSGFFDVIVSTDLVEHLDNNKALIDFLDESHRTLKKGGMLIIHTAPNKLYIELFVKFYQRFINYFFLNTFYLLSGSKKRANFELRSSYDRQVHINEQTYGSMLHNIQKSKFSKFSIKLFSDPFKFNLIKLPYYIIAYLYPLNKFFPFSIILANHIYLAAEK